MAFMRLKLRTVALAVSPLLTACGLVLQQQPVKAQLPLPHHPPGVHIMYVEPTNSAFRPIYDRLKKRELLEQFKQFMAPLRLPSPLLVSLEGCNGKVNAWFSPSQ